jgi:hypothetical protein
MNRLGITENALRHGQIILVRGRAHRVEWALNNRLYLVDARTNEAIISAASQGELRSKIARLEQGAE